MADKRVVIGKFGAAFGVKGWLKVNSFTEPPEGIFDYQPWQMETSQGFKVIEIVDSKVQGKNLVVQVADCEDRTKAQTLTNKAISVLRDQLPSLDDEQYYWTDLEGLTVLLANGDELGVINQFLETGANDVMVVLDGKTRHLVPFIMKTVVKEVDMENRKVIIDWDPDF